MTTAEAYGIAWKRANDCPPDSTAAAAWWEMAKRRRTRITPLWCYSEALEDARASERPDLVRAIRRICGDQHAIAFRLGVSDALIPYCRAELKPRDK
ncbi:MAG: hypothetical protein OXH49_11350 [Gemmatimonadetes bacterium]|nr:hypothetical protein [Gemmatimonadota bacterium]